MKNKFFLLALPVLLIATACQARPQNREVNNIFLEDTLAHDEIFENDNSLGRGLKPLRLGDDPIEHPDNDPAIGIQYAIDNHETPADDSDDTISFRFVAAVTFTNENIGPTVAKWTRTVTKPNGDPFSAKFDTDEVECEKAYKKISNGGSAYTIDQFNAAQDPDTTYTHFVVYCLRNIPLNGTYDDYYISAYLSLTEGATGFSKAVAINVKRTEKYVYTHNLGEYILFGTVGGESYLKTADEIRSTVDATDVAKFNNVSLSDGDSFLIREFYNTKMYIKKPNLTGEGNSVGYWFDGSGDSIETNFDGTYNLSFNKFNQLWVASASNVVSNGELYIDVNVSWWGNDSAWTSVYVYDGTLASGHGKWFALTGTFWGNTFRTHTADAVFTAQSYTAGYTKAVVCRLKNGTNLPDNKTVWDTSIIHNQYDLSLKTNGLEDCIYLYNNVEYSMGKR